MSQGSRPWLSVLVAACNVASYIEATIRSVLSQADADVELLVVDDASSDDTAARVARLATVDPRVRLLRNARNQGVARTRARLVGAARGDYAWFVDGDDLLAPGAIPRLRAMLRREPVDLVTCDFRTLGRSPWSRRRSTFHPRVGTDERTALVTGSLRAGQLHVWSRIARLELWRQVDFPPRSRFEDMSAVAHLLAAARSWRHVPEPWVLYRQRSASLSHAMPVAAMLEYGDGLHDVARILRTAPLEGEARDAVDYYLLRGHASIARRLARSGSLQGAEGLACRRNFEELFPDRGAGALRACRRQGWWLRAWRMMRALDRAGWRRFSRD